MRETNREFWLLLQKSHRQPAAPEHRRRSVRPSPPSARVSHSPHSDTFRSIVFLSSRPLPLFHPPPPPPRCATERPGERNIRWGRMNENFTAHVRRAMIRVRAVRASGSNTRYAEDVCAISETPAILLMCMFKEGSRAVINASPPGPSHFSFLSAFKYPSPLSRKEVSVHPRAPRGSHTRRCIDIAARNDEGPSWLTPHKARGLWVVCRVS